MSSVGCFYWTLCGSIPPGSNNATIKCGFEHGFKMIVPENANSTFDNAFMTGEQSYKYYNEFMWKGRYAECISMEETIKRMKR